MFVTQEGALDVKGHLLYVICGELVFVSRENARLTTLIKDL